jgi:hypothetical protein
MPCSGFAVAATETGLEYQVRLELARLRLNPYLPQYTRLWTPDKTAMPLVRCFPLFPKYVFLPLAEARTREIFYVKGLKLPKPFINNGDGRILTLPEDAVFEVMRIEHEGGFDLTLASRRLTPAAIFASRLAEATAALFRPLLGRDHRQEVEVVPEIEVSDVNVVGLRPGRRHSVVVVPVIAV